MMMIRQLFLTIITIITVHNVQANTPTQLEAQKEAVDIVTAISENLAALIINHKKESNPELTKHHSIELIKKITEIITMCIMKAKAKKISKHITSYDETTLEITINQVAHSIAQMIENEQGII